MSPIIVIRKNVKLWIRGLIATAINGFASGVVLIVADPVAFNLGEGLRKLVMTSTVFALFGLANYLKQHPLPDDDDVVSVTSNGRTLGVLLLPLLLVPVLTSGCATAPIIAAPMEQQIQETRAKALEMAQAVESAGALVVQVGRAATAADSAGVIARPQRDVILRAIIDLEPKALAVIAVAKTVTREPDLRTTLTALMGAFDPLVASLQQSGSGELAKLGDSLRLAYRVIIVYLGGAL
jgi:hypothetical protein